MERADPYRPPRAELSHRPGIGHAAPITRGMIESLEKTRPWVLLIGILMIVGCVIMAVLAVVMLVMGGAGFGGEEFGPMAGAGLGAAYLLLALLYLLPALYLLRYARAIKRITPSSPAAMEEALSRQASFWRIVGIMAIALMAVYALVIAGTAILAIIGAASGT
jgi:hypothetical protein